MTNGEKFKAVTEREQGFLLFCNKHNDDGSCVKCPLNNKCNKRLGCAYAWLDLDVEEEKPMPCPFRKAKERCLMDKIYTAQEMREAAELLKDSGLCLKISDMLRQAVDAMEREEKREKKYEYAHKYGCDIIDSRHVDDRKDCFAPLGAVIVRRPVGEWVEVKE